MSILLALLAVIGGAALAEASSANAWTQTTAQGLMDALGLQLGLPDGANNVSWQMLEQAQMGQVRFTWQGDSYTASYSVDGKKFVEMGTVQATLQDVEAGVIACEGEMPMMMRGGGGRRGGMLLPQAEPLKASFSDFKLVSRGRK